jgi:hypothetical protein
MPQGLNAANNVRFWRCVAADAPEDAIGANVSF